MRNLILLVLLGLTTRINAADILTSADVDELFSTHDRLVLFWSLECPACFKEFALLEEFLEQDPDLRIAMVSTDADADRYAEVDEVYEAFKGPNIEKWVFSSGQGDALIFQIDRGWYGELPRSYFINAQGERTAHSGLLTREELAAWFER